MSCVLYKVKLSPVMKTKMIRNVFQKLKINTFSVFYGATRSVKSTCSTQLYLLYSKSRALSMAN